MAVYDSTVKPPANRIIATKQNKNGGQPVISPKLIILKVCHLFVFVCLFVYLFVFQCFR